MLCCSRLRCSAHYAEFRRRGDRASEDYVGVIKRREAILLVQSDCQRGRETTIQRVSLRNHYHKAAQIHQTP